MVASLPVLGGGLEWPPYQLVPPGGDLSSVPPLGQLAVEPVDRGGGSAIGLQQSCDPSHDLVGQEVI